jgi:hypothetical protein
VGRYSRHRAAANRAAADYAAYKVRRLVKCFIGELKYFRRVFSHSDKCARRCLAFVHVASTVIWLE